ncbi:MAG TPA: hypothetical protein VFC92_01080 [Bacteroidales bacterium]|nr:hypothetical protein [Bacteroidales bacterium]
MKHNEQIKCDLVVALDFAKQIIKNPDLLDEIPEGSVITFLDDETIIKKNPKGENPKRKFVRVKRSFEVL